VTPELEQLLALPEIPAGPWVSARADQFNLSVLSRYGEAYWLPIIGPSSLLMMRRLGTLANLGAFTINLADLAGSLGLGTGVGRSSTVVSTINRLNKFNLVRPWCMEDGIQLQVRRNFPPLSLRQMQMLPDRLRLAIVKEEPHAARTREAD
jgi:hypothetical protein